MRFFLSLILLFLLPGFFVGLKEMFATFVQRSQSFFPILIGSPAGLLLGRYILSRFSGVATFFHELAHAVAALMMFRRVKRFIVTKKRGGEVLHSSGFGGKLGDDFIGLAPYLLPTFTFISILIRPFLPPSMFPWYDGWIGFTFGFHLVSIGREFRLNWSKDTFYTAGSGSISKTDIARRGFVFSFIFIITFFIALQGISLAILSLGYSGVLPWGKFVLTTTWKVGIDVYRWIGTVV